MHVRDFNRHPDGQLALELPGGRTGSDRRVPILPGREQDVLAVIAGRQPDELIFTSLPRRLDVQAYRRIYAQELYLSYAPGRTLPPQQGRLKASDYDKRAVALVAQALGHARIEATLRGYLC